MPRDRPFRVLLSHWGDDDAHEVSMWQVPKVGDWVMMDDGTPREVVRVTWLPFNNWADGEVVVTLA